MRKNHLYRQPVEIVLLLLLETLLIGCTQVETTEEPIMEPIPWLHVSREVFVFEDANADGQYDSGEKPLPGVLVTSHSNIHGGDERTADWTGEEGYTTVEVTYTHYFDIYVVPLCGYEPTTPVSWDAREPESIAVGLAPTQPRPGDALVRFFLWFDQDHDGVQDEAELPLDDTGLQIILTEGDHEAERVEWDALALTTGDDGWGEINLGNSCGTLTLANREFEPWEFGFWEVTQAQPEPVFVGLDGQETEARDQYAEFAYGPGETIIRIGLAPVTGRVLQTAHRQVLVFADANANGTYDPGERPLPNIPVYHWAGLARGGQRGLAFTDDAGQLSIEALYSDELQVKAVAPCGYAPTTPLLQTVTQPSDDVLYFGFEPDAPEEGAARVRVHLWHDQNENGEQEPDEPSLGGEIVRVYPFDDSGYGFHVLDAEHDAAAASTDEDGWAEFDLGNTCGALEVDLSDMPGGLNQVTISRQGPQPVGIETLGSPFVLGVQYKYDQGVTEIRIGMIAWSG